MEITDELDDLDDPTKPFTHAQIGRMLNDAERAPVQREYEVDLSYFFGFGDAGTPSGMIGSQAGPVASGTCGDPPRVKPQPPRVQPRPPRPPASPESDLYPWGPAPAELSGEPPVPNFGLSPPEPAPPLPSTLPDAMAPRAVGDALEEDLRGAGLRSRAGLFVVVGALLACGVATLVWWLTLPVPLPPPDPGPPEQIAMVMNDYDDDDDEDEDEDETGETTGRAGPKAGQVLGEVSIDGPSDLETIPPWKTPHCSTQRERADQAFRAGKWSQLEDLSRETKCWRPARKAKVLRMNALFELGRLDDCAKVGDGSKNKEIEKWMKLCSHGRG